MKLFDEITAIDLATCASPDGGEETDTVVGTLPEDLQKLSALRRKIEEEIDDFASAGDAELDTVLNEGREERYQELRKKLQLLESKKEAVQKLIEYELSELFPEAVGTRAFIGKDWTLRIRTGCVMGSCDTCPIRELAHAM